MTPADPLTPEEVERLDPETRKYYQCAMLSLRPDYDKRFAANTLVSDAWLRDHITRAAWMGAAIRAWAEVPMTAEPEDELAAQMRLLESIGALAPTERSK